MAHIDHDRVSTLDSLINISDAAARTALVRLRERLARIAPDLDERLVFDSRHHKPVLAWYRGKDPVLHLFPEPNVALGLHCDVPIRTAERTLLDLRGLPERVGEAVTRARPRHGIVWVELVLHSASAADELLELLQRRLELLPTEH